MASVPICVVMEPPVIDSGKIKKETLKEHFMHANGNFVTVLGVQSFDVVVVVVEREMECNQQES